MSFPRNQSNISFASMPDDVLANIFILLDAKQLWDLIQFQHHRIRRVAMFCLWSKRDEDSIKMQFKHAIQLLHNSTLDQDIPASLIINSLEQLAHKQETSMTQRIIALTLLAILNLYTDKFSELLNELLIAGQTDPMLFLVMRSKIAQHLKSDTLYQTLCQQIYSYTENLKYPPNDSLLFLSFLSKGQINYLFLACLEKMKIDQANQLDFIVLEKIASRLGTEQVALLYPYLMLNLQLNPVSNIVLSAIKLLAICKPKLSQTLQQQTFEKLYANLENDFRIIRSLLPSGKLTDGETLALQKISACYSFLPPDITHELLIIFLTLLESMQTNKRELAQRELHKLGPYLARPSCAYAAESLLACCFHERSIKKIAAFLGIPTIIDYLEPIDKDKLIDALITAFMALAAQIGDPVHQHSVTAIINIAPQLNSQQIDRILEILTSNLREHVAIGSIDRNFSMYFDLLRNIVASFATKLSEENISYLISSLQPYLLVPEFNMFPNVISILNIIKTKISAEQFQHLFTDILSSWEIRDRDHPIHVLNFLCSRALEPQQRELLQLHCDEWELTPPYVHPRLCVLEHEQYNPILQEALTNFNSQLISNLTPYLSPEQLTRLGETLAARLSSASQRVASAQLLLCDLIRHPIIFEVVTDVLLTTHSPLLQPLLELARQTLQPLPRLGSRTSLFDEARTDSSLRDDSVSQRPPSPRSGRPE